MNFTDIFKAVDLHNNSLSRRQFFRQNAMGLGAAALTSLLPKEVMGAIEKATGNSHFAPKAKRVIYISLIGAPSQFETFDYKPHLQKEFKKDIKDFLVKSGQRLTGMTAGQTKFPVAPSFVDFKQYGESGTWVSDLLPWTGKMVDDLCIIKSMHTDAINHEPANQLIYTGSMQSGKASMGSWLSYGLGSLNNDLPTFCVLHAQHSSPYANVQAISSRLWGSGFLPGKHAGVNLRSSGDPVLFLKDAPGIDRDMRRSMLDGLSNLNQKTLENVGDPEIQTRIEQYEMAYRMQMSVPELTDMSEESEATYELYGPDSKKAGSFAYCALMARRLAERGVRFTQIFHRGWDQHGNLPRDISSQCKDVDQACYGLIQDLKQRGLLEDTLVVFGGEFGRTVYSQGQLTDKNYGRDHHPRAFSLWLAGAGVKGGMTYGETDEYSFNIVTPDQKVHVRDLHATILERCGLDFHKFSYLYQGLENKLTGVEPARVVTDILHSSHMAKKGHG
ncbi:Protein of unknown function [Rubritalea squalenifaciens DSM 18772]|uniref:Tat (Twin-arginine translocation) pathway signal sequence n=1 Tax=Rubritalea squalenifaciens DSM 18772 TaxID=1123071 RepID=A0A1M6HCB9_9BACT|nr:DUF1501 domain-containing protein [Rubritalea squalenifaciens]SHJ19847.1 Protein of unknown function [Rubritalea squalenifaciens DSM 18772]